MANELNNALAKDPGQLTEYDKGVIRRAADLLDEDERQRFADVLGTPEPGYESRFTDTAPIGETDEEADPANAGY